MAMRKRPSKPENAGVNCPAGIGEEDNGEYQAGMSVPGTFRAIAIAGFSEQQPGGPGKGVEEGDMSGAVMGEELGEGLEDQRAEEGGGMREFLQAQETICPYPTPQQVGDDEQVET